MIIWLEGERPISRCEEEIQNRKVADDKRRKFSFPDPSRQYKIRF